MCISAVLVYLIIIIIIIIRIYINIKKKKCELKWDTRKQGLRLFAMCFPTTRCH